MKSVLINWGGETINSDNDTGDTQPEFGQQGF